MSARPPKPGPGGRPPSPLSRRRFVALAGAGLAALSAAGPALGATAPEKTGTAARPKKPAAGAAHPAGTTPAPAPQQKEFERQRSGTLSALKTIRAYPLPPGGDLPVVFKPMREPKKER